MKLRLILGVLAALVALPSSALAARCAPPGVSGVDQYFETVPGASCNPPSSGAGGGHGGRGGHLPRGVSRQLAAQGPTGRAVERLVSSTGTYDAGAAGAGKSGHGLPGSSSRHAVNAVHAKAPTASGRSLLSALLHPILTGSAVGGTGALLPVFLAGVLVLVLAGTVHRRRRLRRARTLFGAR
jgi:hypothetical protein